MYSIDSMMASNEHPAKIRTRILFYSISVPFLLHFYTFFTHFLKTAAPFRTPAP